MSLNNLSIRLQVLIPLLLASLLMILMIGIGKRDIDNAIGDMNDTTVSVTRHKDDIATLIHATYRLRTTAIYGLYDPERFATLPGDLTAAERRSAPSWPDWSSPAPSRTTAGWRSPCRPTSATPATTCCRCWPPSTRVAVIPPPMSRPAYAFASWGRSHQADRCHVGAHQPADPG